MNIYLRTLKFYMRNTYATAKNAVALCRELPLFFRDARHIRKSLQGNKDFAISTAYPCLLDRRAEGGTASGHYFHQDLWVAQQININKPQRHVDIASRVDGFVAHVASFREIEVLDVRPVTTQIQNVSFVQADLMETNSKFEDYCDSMSCLHALEHFGLGRYGDTLDIDGHLKGFANMGKLLKKGGTFYFSTPIGPQRIEFNAHRVFSIEYLLNMFQGQYIVDKFCYVDDKGDLHRDVSLDDKNAVQNNFGCYWGCGIFKLTKV
jgi:SAM-dependent methyltransferase